MNIHHHRTNRFFQDKRVKVSLFLNEGIQLQSGKLVMPSCCNDQVGVVRTFGADGKLESEEKLQVASQKVSLQFQTVAGLGLMLASQMLRLL